MGRTHSFKGAGIAFGVFAVYTLLVKFVDVAEAGLTNTAVGFSHINRFFFGMFGGNDFCYKLTQFIGYISLLICLAFGVMGVVQLVKGKSLKAVDPRIITLGIFYVIVILFYVVFNVVAINYRPVLEDGVLEASYPSSHTMLALTVFYSLVRYVERCKVSRSVKQYVTGAAFAVMLVAIIGRLVSGVHWFTDIVGAIILSIAIMKLYTPIYDRVKNILAK